MEQKPNDGPDLLDVSDNPTDVSESVARGNAVRSEIARDIRTDLGHVEVEDDGDVTVHPSFEPRPITEAEHRAELGEEFGDPEVFEECVVPHPPPFREADNCPHRDRASLKVADIRAAAEMFEEKGYSPDLVDAEGMLRPEKKNDPDLINTPSHYLFGAGRVECIDAIEAALTPDEFRGFCKGSALKYIWRSNHKGARDQDLQKCSWYSRMAAGDDPREN